MNERAAAKRKKSVKRQLFFAIKLLIQSPAIERKYAPLNKKKRKIKVL